MNTFILIDSAQIEQADKVPALADDVRPSWLVPIYQERAYAVSPLLIDVAAAAEADAIAPMMDMANACWPQLHSSIIDTDLGLLELAEHLRKFIHVNTEEGEELTLRFADCAVLPALAEHLSGEQWTAMVFPLIRWRIHLRDGSLKSLATSNPGLQPAAPPFTLTGEQLASIKDALGVDRLLANLRAISPGARLGKTPMETYQWASDARRMWLAAGRSEDAQLMTFLRGVFKTNGRTLRVSTMPQILADPDEAKVREGIRKSIEINTYGEER